MRLSTCGVGFLFVVIGLYLPGPAGAQTAFDETLAGIDAFGASALYCGLASDLGLSVAPGGPSGDAQSRPGASKDGGLALAVENKLQIGGRFGIILADGEPANDMMMYGVYGRYRLRPNWHWGFGVDFLSFDFERPYRVLGLQSTVENDAPASNTVIHTSLEYELRRGSPNWVPFILGGIGVGIVDVDDVRGDLLGGGTYDITTDGGTEVIPMVGVGLRYLLGNRFAAELGFRAQYHIGGWDVVDRTSGRKGSVDDYLAYGAYAGLVFRF